MYNVAHGNLAIHASANFNKLIKYNEFHPFAQPSVHKYGELVTLVQYVGIVVLEQKDFTLLNVQDVGIKNYGTK